MNETENENRRRPVNNRWIDRVWALFSAIGLTLLGGIGWVIWNDHEINREQVVMINAITQEVAKIKENLDMRGAVWYPRHEADREHEQLDYRLSDHEQRLRNLERHNIWSTERQNRQDESDKP